MPLLVATEIRTIILYFVRESTYSMERASITLALLMRLSFFIVIITVNYGTAS